MATVLENGEKLLATAQELAETKFEIVKLKFIGKVSGSMSSIIAIIMVIVFATGALIVVSFGLSYLIGASLGNISYGFFIVGAVYALAGLLIYVNRSKWIERPLKDLFIDKITGNDD